jgi:hypothetical protein
MCLPFFGYSHALSIRHRALIGSVDSNPGTLLADGADSHEKIRFSRKDRHDLDRLPSADARHSARARGRRAFHGLTRVFVWGLFAMLLTVMGAVGWLAVFGYSNSYFSQTAESLIQRMAGPSLSTKLESAKLSLDSAGNLAFQGSNLAVVSNGSGGISGRADEVRIGLKSMSLLGGNFDVAHFDANGVKLVMASGGIGFLDRLKTPDGRLSPAELPSALAAMVDLVRTQLAARNADDISLTNVSFSSQSGGMAYPIIKTLQVNSNDDESFALKGEVDFAGKSIVFAGEINDAGRYSLTVPGLSFGIAESDPSFPAGQLRTGVALNVGIFGNKVLGKDRMAVTAGIDQLVWTTRKEIRYSGAGTLNFEILQGSDKVEVLPSNLAFGSNRFSFSGALGLLPDQDASDQQSYRFELVSNDSQLLPSDSPERRLDLAFQLSGTADSKLKAFRFSDMSVRTLGGDMIGQGSLQFAGGSPEMMFGVRIPKMKISDAKQLWPSFIASGARKWVLDHVYGGTLVDSRIDATFQSRSFDPLPSGRIRPALTADQVSADFNIQNARFDVIGDLPPVRDASGRVEVRGANTSITVGSGTAYLENGATADVSEGAMKIPYVVGQPVVAELSINVAGQASTIADLANREPIFALKSAPVAAADLSGNAKAHIVASFPLRKSDTAPRTVWKAAVDFEGLSIAKDFSGQKLSDAAGRLEVDQQVATFIAKGKLNGVPAEITLTEPIGGPGKRELSAKLKLDDKARNILAPGLGNLIEGVTTVEVNDAGNGAQLVQADLRNSTINLPFAGWSKGNGVAATATFKLSKKGNSTSIEDFELEGDTFRFAGNINLEAGKFSKAEFSSVKLNRGDNAAVTVQRVKGGYEVSVNAKSLDLRSLLKRVTSNFESTAKATGSDTIRVKASIGSVTGFGGEQLQNLQAAYTGRGTTILAFTAIGTTSNGGAVSVENRFSDGRKTVQIQTADGGSLLRFLDYYDKMSGGQISVSLSSTGDGPLGGEIDARNFTVVGEPRLKSLVGSPVTPDGQNVANASKKKIDVSRVRFERGYSVIQKGTGYLKLAKGILRSDQIGLSYEGTLYDRDGRINMNGTFLPAYGLNRIFGAIPLVGEILGNGRDKGLIGITFKLSGSAKSPKLTVNPISLVAPGIFRQIFEFQ